MQCKGLAIWKEVKPVSATWKLEAGLADSIAKTCSFIQAEFDASWSRQNKPDPAVKPQTHMAKVRSEPIYKVKIPGIQSEIDTQKMKVFHMIPEAMQFVPVPYPAISSATTPAPVTTAAPTKAPALTDKNSQTVAPTPISNVVVKPSAPVTVEPKPTVTPVTPVAKPIQSGGSNSLQYVLWLLLGVTVVLITCNGVELYKRSRGVWKSPQFQTLEDRFDLRSAEMDAGVGKDDFVIENLDIDLGSEAPSSARPEDNDNNYVGKHVSP